MVLTIEGRWEEILQRAEEFRGKRVRLIVLDAEAAPAPTLDAWQEFLANLEPLTEEQIAILEREARRRSLFEGREE
ncbi:MAG: hypothetical protein ABDI19_03420 [Armatimonadota bacterium]